MEIKNMSSNLNLFNVDTVENESFSDNNFCRNS